MIFEGLFKYGWEKNIPLNVEKNVNKNKQICILAYKNVGFLRVSRDYASEDQGVAYMVLSDSFFFHFTSLS